MALSHSWDEDRGQWVPRELVQGKVAFPTWPTYYRLKALEEEMAKAAGVEQSEDGTFVSASLEVGVLEAIAHIEKVCDVQLDLAEEEMLKTLHEECGVYIKAKHVKATSKSGNARAPEKPTIIGREALSLLEKFDDDGPGGANRAHKASEVQEQAEIFFNAFLQVATPEAVTTYMHDLVGHIPSQVLAFGDLRLYTLKRG
eukprot:jgi/Mesvir1/5933/Mv00700-RA.1